MCMTCIAQKSDWENVRIFFSEILPGKSSITGEILFTGEINMQHIVLLYLLIAHHESCLCMRGCTACTVLFLFILHSLL